MAPYAPYRTGIAAIATVLIGNNDFPQMTGEAAYAQKLQLLALLRGDGFYIVDITVTPAASQPPGSQWDNRRLAYNALTLADSPTAANYAYDLSALLPDPNDATYYADGTHYTVAGNMLIANSLYPAVKLGIGWP